MATYVYDEFRVTFTPRAEGDFALRAVDAEGTETTGVFVLPLSDAELERAVLEVANARAIRRTRRACRGPPVTTADHRRSPP